MHPSLELPNFLCLAPDLDAIYNEVSELRQDQLLNNPRGYTRPTRI